MKSKNFLCLKNCCTSINAADMDKEETINETCEKRKAYFGQLISIICGYIFMIDCGGNMSWTSPALPYLTSENFITDAQGAFLVASISLFSIFGYLLSPIIMNRIGRKYTILVFGLIQLLSKILLCIKAPNFTILLISRLFVGIGGSGMFAFFPLYIGEICAETIRGRFLILDKIFVNFGAFLMATAGAFLQYNSMNLVMALIPLIALGSFPLTTETPYYYLLKGREEEAIKTLMKLSGEKRREIVIINIERMKKAICEGQESKNNNFRELFTERGSRRGFMIKFIAEVTYVSSGYMIILAYAESIFSMSGSLEPKYLVMLMTAMQMLASLPTSQIVDRWGRRPTFLLSGILCTVSLTIVGLFFFFKLFLEVDVSSFTWLPLVGLISYTFSCNIGLSTIPYVYRGELFSVKVKGIATLISSMLASIFVFVLKMLWPLINNYFGIYTSFWIFGFSCLLGSLTVFYIAPETKGRNLEEILELLRAKKKNLKTKNNC